MEKSGEDLEMDFAVDIATVPYRIPNRPAPELKFGKLHVYFNICLFRSIIQTNSELVRKTHLQRFLHLRMSFSLSFCVCPVFSYLLTTPINLAIMKQNQRIKGFSITFIHCVSMWRVFVRPNEMNSQRNYHESDKSFFFLGLRNMQESSSIPV